MKKAKKLYAAQEMKMAMMMYMRAMGMRMRFDAQISDRSASSSKELETA